MLELLTGLRTAFAGKKTYVVAVIVVLIGVVEGYLGFDIPGADVGGDPLGYILNGLGLGTLRAGVGKLGLRF